LYDIDYIMEALVVYPENKAQLTALKAVMKAMNVSFEQRDEVYPDYVVKGIKRAIKQTEQGELKPYTGIRNMLLRK